MIFEHGFMGKNDFWHESTGNIGFWLGFMGKMGLWPWVLGKKNMKKIWRFWVWHVRFQGVAS